MTEGVKIFIAEVNSKLLTMQIGLNPHGWCGLDVLSKHVYVPQNILSGGMSVRVLPFGQFLDVEAILVW